MQRSRIPPARETISNVPLFFFFFYQDDGYGRRAAIHQLSPWKTTKHPDGFSRWEARVSHVTQQKRAQT